MEWTDYVTERYTVELPTGAEVLPIPNGWAVAKIDGFDFLIPADLVFQFAKRGQQGFKIVEGPIPGF